MKDVIRHIETEKKVYPIVFNLNVMEEADGSMDAGGDCVSGDGEPKIKDLKAGLLAMMNEAIDIENEEKGTSEPLLTSKQVGRIISEVGFEAITQAMMEITVASTKDGDEGKNA